MTNNSMYQDCLNLRNLHRFLVLYITCYCGFCQERVPLPLGAKDKLRFCGTFCAFQLTSLFNIHKHSSLSFFKQLKFALT